MKVPEIRAARLNLIRRMLTMGNDIESDTFNAFQTMPVIKPAPNVMDLVQRNDKTYQQRLEQIIYRLGAAKNFNRVADKLHPVNATPRSIVVEMVVGKDHVNNKGTLHGGQTAALVDIVTSRAVAVTHKNTPMSSTDLSVSYFLPVNIGETILIKATVLKAGNTMAFTEVEFRRQVDNALVAKGKHNLAFLPIPKDKVNNLEPYF